MPGFQKKLVYSEVSLRTVQILRESLEEISGRNKVKLFWVPGYREAVGNEWPDCLSTNGFESELRKVQIELSTLAVKSDDVTSHWLGLQMSRQTKPRYDKHQ